MEGVMDIEEQVYGTLLKALEEESELSWVTPVFVPGHPCYETYCQMLAAYDRLRQRLGREEPDADAEAMIDCLLNHGKLLALEMFRCGRRYQQALESLTSPEGLDPL